MIRVAGHFGELLQGRLGPDGPVALISLPCPALSVEARRVGNGRMSLDETSQLLVSLERTQAFLRKLGLTLTGEVSLRAQMPVGGGAGASTAALVALAKLAGFSGTAEDLAAACIASEGATDPLMFAQPERMLWASRRGEVLRALPPLPAFEVVGGFYGAPARTDPEDIDFPDIGPLVAQWKEAAEAGDLGTLAALCSQSAEQSLTLRGGDDEPISGLANQLGALGYVIAHTGSARGLIFARGAVPAQARDSLMQAGLQQVVQFEAGGPA